MGSLEMVHNNGEPARALVVDDEHAIRTVMARWLAMEGLICDTAANADQALALLAEQPYELMISDIMMPGKSGIELLEIVRQFHPDTAVVMVTAVDHQDMGIRALELGAYGYIIKPLERNELLINTANALERRRLTLLARATHEDLEQQVRQRTEEIALAHHEKWDGSGYPSFLAGTDIPEAARIVAIADVYDALSNDRVYRPAMPEDKVMAIMLEGRGSHFDPRIFDAFLDALPEFRRILAENHDDLARVQAPPKAGTAVVSGEATTPMTNDNTPEGQTHVMRAIIDAIPSPFHVVHADTYEIVFSNNASRGQGEVLGWPCYEVSHHQETPCDSAEHLCPLKMVRETGREVVVEHLHQDQNGKDQFIEIHGYPLFDGQGCLTHMIEFALDITQRKLAVRQLVKKNRELEIANQTLEKARQELRHQEKPACIGQLAAGVAHEINNPLSYVSSNLRTLPGYIEKFTTFVAAQAVALAKLPDQTAVEELAELRRRLKLDFVTQDLKELVADAMEGVERIAGIVNGLKSFARKGEDEWRPTALNECLDNTLKVVWNELKYKAEVVKEFGALPLVPCFPQQLNQVFMNLLVNAAHAIEKQGRITINTRQEGDAVYVSIADTGHGIPEDRLTRIFEPFFTTKPVGQGTGLGLSIVKEIVDRHHGSITVTSQEGQGSTFTLRLLMQPAANDSNPASPLQE